MSNGRTPRGRTRIDPSRDGGGFVAMPWSVLDCPAYARLSHVARSLLWEIARQYVRDNNGRLLCSMRYLAPRGWNSNDVITRSKRELLAAGFIYETVMGHRPNKASWYAITWHTLDKLRGFDAGAERGFKRSAYLPIAMPDAKPTREELYERWRGGEARRGAEPKPPHSAEGMQTSPASGESEVSTAPLGGAIQPKFDLVSSPPRGKHLERPSAGAGHGPSSFSVDEKGCWLAANVPGSAMLQ